MNVVAHRKTDGVVKESGLCIVCMSGWSLNRVRMEIRVVVKVSYLEHRV